MFTKRNIIIGSVIILALLFVFYFGYQRGTINQDNKETKTKIEYIEKEIKLSQNKIDSIKNSVKKDTEIVIKWKEKIKEVEKDYKDIKPPTDTICNKVYQEYVKSNNNLKTQISLKDSVIRIQDTIIKKQNLQLVLKDDVISKKDIQIDLLNQNKKVKQKRIGIGLQAGMTVNSDREFKPYIGGGISYNFLNL